MLHTPLKICLIILIVNFSISPLQAQEKNESTTTVGFAERDITPDIGMERPGGYGKVFHKVLHDPCKVRAAVFRNGEQQVAIVSVDALLIRRQLVLAARKRIQEQCGINPDAVMIHATHSHSSGPTGMIYPGEYDHAEDFVQILAYEKSSNANLQYVQHVEDQIVAAVCAASGQQTAKECNIGSGQAEGVAFNRRFYMTNGLTQTHPRPGNPEIIEPAGPVDPEVGVIGAWDAEGNLVGCLVNFSCHATASPPGISANYIYFVEQVIRGVFGDQVIVVFLAGASGDVTQVENLTQYARRPAKESSRFVGGTVGAEAVKVLLREPRGNLTPLAFKSTVLKLSRRPPSPERVKQAIQLVQQKPAEVGATEWAFAKEIVLLDARLKKEPIADVEVQAIQVGPAVFISDPAEYFVQFGMEIKADSHFPMTFPVSLANGCVGYVPTREAFGPRGGGYETRLTGYSNLEINAGDKIVIASLDLIDELNPGPMPTRPPAPEFTAPWSYGAVPPELE